MGTRAVGVLIALLVLGTGAAAVLLNLHHGKTRFAGPPPTLFDTSDLSLVDGPMWSAHQQAAQMVAAWLRANPNASPAAFAPWAVAAMPAPPVAAGPEQRQELAVMEHLKTIRTPGGLLAARWLSINAKNVWKIYRQQYEQLAPIAEGKPAKSLLKRTLALAATVETAARNRFGQPSPYQGDPTLLADVKDRGVKKFSYPSNHATFTFAALTVLSKLDPLREAEYRRMADEIAYSRIYAGAHYPHDLTGGALLGTLVGEYELQAPAAPTGKGLIRQP